MYMPSVTCRVGPRWTHAEYAGMWASCTQEERYWIEDVEGTIPADLEVMSLSCVGCNKRDQGCSHQCNFSFHAAPPSAKPDLCNTLHLCCANVAKLQFHMRVIHET